MPNRLWVANITIPNLDCRPEYFACAEQPTAEQVCAALDMRARSPGDPNERGIGHQERMNRLYPLVRIKEIHPREL